MVIMGVNLKGCLTSVMAALRHRNEVIIMVIMDLLGSFNLYCVEIYDRLDWQCLDLRKFLLRKCTLVYLSRRWGKTVLKRVKWPVRSDGNSRKWSYESPWVRLRFNALAQATRCKMAEKSIRMAFSVLWVSWLAYSGNDRENLKSAW